jgi:hypothetical protein
LSIILLIGKVINITPGNNKIISKCGYPARVEGPVKGWAKVAASVAANRPSVLKAREIGKRIISKMKEFINVFVRGVAA